MPGEGAPGSVSRHIAANPAIIQQMREREHEKKREKCLKEGGNLDGTHRFAPKTRTELSLKYSRILPFSQI